jgi:integrase/recombinase XerD
MILASNYVQSFLSYLQANRGYAKNTILAYGRDTMYFIVWLKGEGICNAADIKEIHIENYIAHFHQFKFSHSTINRKIASLKHFTSYLYKIKIILVDPAKNFGWLKAAEPLPKAISEIDISTLIQAPDVNSFIGVRDRAMLELLYATGLRISELIDLQYEDVDLTRMCVTRQGFYHRLKKYVKQCNLSGDISAHNIRHSFATHLLDHGADIRSIQLLLGHSDISSTEIYTHVAVKKLGEMHKKHHPRG